MPNDEPKQRICAAIDARRDDLLAIADDILRHPETGFRETRTARVVAEQFARMGLACQEGLAITGVKARLTGAAPGPTVAVLGELDALFCAGHPFADPQTGAAHACGHHAQIATLLGVGMGLLASQAMSALSGNVVLMACPAEEMIELQFRLDLRRQGKLEFLGGKQELIRVGAFDDVDMAMMVHSTSRPEDRLGKLSDSSNGTVVKSVQFLGRPAHAGSSPHLGVNALNAAMLAINAMHAQRETFRDQDTVRLHAIITKGGEAVNVVPSDVRMEVRVRGKTLDSMRDANAKVDRALKAGALAVGATLRMQTLRGYFPLQTNHPLGEVYKSNIISLIGPDQWVEGGHGTGSTDMSDVSHIMPAIHPYTGGATGTSHGSDYLVSDPDLVILNAAKAQAMTVVDLLSDGARVARRVLAESPTPLTKEQYVAAVRDMNSEIEYSGEKE